MSEQLKRKGLKVTLPRTKVLSFLENAKGRHLSAEEIYQAMLQAGEDVSLATIYRVLSQFEAAQIVERHRFENDRSVFELKDIEPHDHLICESCGQVVEVNDRHLSAVKEQIAVLNDFQISDHSICIYGICRDCQ